MQISRWNVLVLALGCGSIYAAHAPAGPGPAFGRCYVSLFNDMDLVKKGEFGVSRVPMYHSTILGGGRKNDTEQNALLLLRQRTIMNGYDVSEGFIEVAPVGDDSHRFYKPGQLAWIGPIPVDGNGQPMYDVSNPKLADFAAKTITKVDHSESGTYTTALGNYAFFAQRIPFEHAECISCHSKSKVGDTAAVFVLAYKRK